MPGAAGPNGARAASFGSERAATAHHGAAALYPSGVAVSLFAGTHTN